MAATSQPLQHQVPGHSKKGGSAMDAAIAAITQF